MNLSIFNNKFNMDFKKIEYVAICYIKFFVVKKIPHKYVSRSLMYLNSPQEKKNIAFFIQSIIKQLTSLYNNIIKVFFYYF